MARSRLALSAFLLWHVTAVAFGAFEPPNRWERTIVVRHPTGGWLTSALTPFMDQTVAAVGVAYSFVRNTTSPIRQATGLYLGATGIGQNWAMFPDPRPFHRYTRVRYFVGSAASSTWSATEIVYPVHATDQVRLIESFRDSFEEKALETSSLRTHAPRATGQAERLDEPNEELAPVGRFYASRFAQHHLRPTEHVVRVEVWAGTAPFDLKDPQARAAELLIRQDFLQVYASGPVEHHVASSGVATVGAIDRQVDITWVLRYVETR